MTFNKEKCFFWRNEAAAKSKLFGAESPLVPDSRVKALKIAAAAAYILMLAMQLYNIFTFNGNLLSDEIRYIHDTFEHVHDSTWYPMAYDFDAGSIAATGLINFYIFLLRIKEDMKMIYFAQLLLVQLMLFSTCYIARKVTGSNTVQYLTATFFCLFGTFWSEICIARTEIFFTSLAVFAMALCVKNGKFSVIAAGVILAYANWARPLAMAFIVAIVWYFLCNGAKFRQYVKLIGAFCVTALLLATFTYFNSGEFLYQPTIASGNFLMGANEFADGSYNNEIFWEGNAAHLTPEQKQEMGHEQINAFFNSIAINWIKENPTDYLKLLPKKLFYFLATETYSGSVYFDNTKATGGLAYIKELVSILTGSGSRALQLGDIVIMYTQGFYMLVLALFLVGVVYSMKKGYWRSMSFLYGTFLIGVASALYTVGAARYRFPYIFVMIITAAAFTDAVFVRRKNKGKKI